MTDSQPSELQGAQKAVLLLLSLDETVATPIIAELSETELRRLREVASEMRTVPSSALGQVYGEFVRESREAVAVPKGGVHYLQRLTTRALGEAQSNAIFQEAQPTPISRLAHADPGALAAVLENEHPQLIAAIVSQMPTPESASLMRELRPVLRAQVVERLGRMTEVPAQLLEEIAQVLSAELPQRSESTVLSINGLSQSAALVRKLGKEVGEEVLQVLDQDNSELAAEIRRSMYTFEELSNLHPKAMRSLLEAVPVERLTLALKTASDALKKTVFESMSKRAAERIREDMEILGSVRLAEVEGAQREIVETALRLDKEGTIQLNAEEA
ncbi:MAG TPA: FliG C-terminal domain-containing protein [Polyangiaceae bacterium]|nr:FliG C-terminal domain-containing protein [Polyangiaceae bacterium]